MTSNPFQQHRVPLVLQALGVGGDDLVDPALVQSAGSGHVFWKADPATYVLWIEGDGDATTALGFTQGDRGSSASRAFSARLTWEPGRWYHVAVARTGSQITLYRDGVAIGTGSIADPPQPTTPSPLVLGAAEEGDPAGVYTPLKGGLDEVEVFDRALSVGEIAGLHGSVTGACP